jgi:hypothetical protein
VTLVEGGENWECPYCNRAQTVTSGQVYSGRAWLKLSKHKYGEAVLEIDAVACANPKCEEVTLSTTFGKATRFNGPQGPSIHNFLEIQEYKLRPTSAAKPQPDFIPGPIREDYLEACSIRDLSPKAAATLARRCIQGIIRDFCGISKAKLVQEINELKSRVESGTAPSGVTPETVEAIDYVRSIGNIGAHMEADINLVIPVDPGEAQALINLIELLFAEWYVAREIRRARLTAVKQIADNKKSFKAAKTASSQN